MAFYSYTNLFWLVWIKKSEEEQEAGSYDRERGGISQKTRVIFRIFQFLCLPSPFANSLGQADSRYFVNPLPEQLMPHAVEWVMGPRDGSGNTRPENFANVSPRLVCIPSMACSPPHSLVLNEDVPLLLKAQFNSVYKQASVGRSMIAMYTGTSH